MKVQIDSFPVRINLLSLDFTDYCSLNFNVLQNHCECLLKMQISGFFLQRFRFHRSGVEGETQQLTFLTNPLCNSDKGGPQTLPKHMALHI